jgi:pimeloyl-ACP methyl ester carboxylesterase
MPTVRTETLEIAYETGGPANGEPLLLLHGWPDDVRGWRGITPSLEQAGYRWFAPWLRGFGPTRFLSTETFRDGSGVALAKDAVDLADALGLSRFSVIGHDWGGRTAYTLAALFPKRLKTIVSLALSYAPRGEFRTPGFSQARLWWYQWFMTADRGADAVRADPKGFARIQWDTWSPPGWFDEAEFDATAASFENPDWTAITLNAYRSRWKEESSDPRLASLREKLASVGSLSVPTLMIQGADDRCDPPAESEGQGQYFTGGHRRVLLDGVGHFPAREAPAAVAAVITSYLSEQLS